MIEVLPPADVYLDTAAFVGAVVPGAPHATACLEFWAQLIRYRSRVYYSRILWLELPHALRGLATKPRQVDARTRQRYRLDAWGADPAVRERWLRDGLGAVDQLLDRCAEATELPYTREVWQRAVELMVRSTLGSLDATHAATALEFGVPALASVDDDFRGVVGLDFMLLRDPTP